MLVVISNAFLFKTESNSQSPTPGCVRHDQNIHLQAFPIWDQVRKDSSSDKTIQIKIREMLLCVWVFACGVCACLHCIQFQLRNQHNHEVMFKNKILFCNNHCPYFLRLQCSQPITQATAFFSITTCNLFVSPKSIVLPALPALPAILFKHAVHSLFVVQCRNIFFFLQHFTDCDSQSFRVDFIVQGCHVFFLQTSTFTAVNVFVDFTVQSHYTIMQTLHQICHTCLA